MTNSCRRPAMRWNEVTGAIARHKRASTQCGRLNTFASVSPRTCSGISRRPIAHRPRRPCIRPVLGRKNSKNDATVSFFLLLRRLLPLIRRLRSGFVPTDYTERHPDLHEDPPDLPQRVEIEVSAFFVYMSKEQW